MPRGSIARDSISSGVHAQAEHDEGHTPARKRASTRRGSSWPVRQMNLAAEHGLTSNDTTFLAACASGDVPKINELLSAGCSINTVSEDGATGLWKAAFQGHAAAVTRLLVPAADVNCAKTGTGTSPLWVAAFNGHHECVRVLLEHQRIDVNLGSSDGATALYIAASTGHVECVRQLLNIASVDVNRANTHGRTPLFKAAARSHTECVRLLLEHSSIDVNLAQLDTGDTPLSIAAREGNEDCVRLLLALPEVAVDRQSHNGFTPLMAACNSQVGVGAALAIAGSGKADLDVTVQHAAVDGGVTDWTALTFAHVADSTSLVAYLIGQGADPRAVFKHEAVAFATHGNAFFAARALQGSQHPAAVVGALPPLVCACLMGDPSLTGADPDELAALVARSPTYVFEADQRPPYYGNVPPALFFAVELLGYDACTLTATAAEASAASHRRSAYEPAAAPAPAPAPAPLGATDEGVLRALLGLSSTLSEGVREAILHAARMAAGAHDAHDSEGYVAGARFHTFLLALGAAGHLDTLKTKGVRHLAQWYISSVAGARHMMEAGPEAFDALKRMCDGRLVEIAKPLDTLCEAEQLMRRLGGIGAEHVGAVAALDAPGLLPMPPFVSGIPPHEPAYEGYLIRLIRLVSLALDDLFISRLRAALAPLGDGTWREGETTDAGKPITRIRDAAGKVLIDIRRAPPKAMARMLNKLGNDHRAKARPRPKWNVDAVRALVVVHNADLFAPVYAAIGRGVGRYLRVKNGFASPESTFGYRAVLANVAVESGLTVQQVFGGTQRSLWQALGTARAALGDGEAKAEYEELLDALLATSTEWYDAHNAGVRATAVNTVAEVQLVYRPYFEQGRKLSHLPYKVVRCHSSAELVFDASGKRGQLDPAFQAAERACMAIVERVLSQDATRSEVRKGGQSAPSAENKPARASPGGRNSSSAACVLL